MACAILHNILIKNNVPIGEDDFVEIEEDDKNHHNRNSWRYSAIAPNEKGCGSNTKA